MAHARQARHYLLDPRFQIKWTSYLVIVVLAVTAGLGFLIARLAGRTANTAEIAVTQAEKAHKESKANNELARSAVEMAQPDNQILAGAVNEELEKVEKKQDQNLAEVRRLQDDIARDRKNLKTLLWGAGLALLLLLSIMGIIITHRVVGPVHKLKRLLRQVSTGRLLIEERLRKGDELEDLFETFLQMTHSLRAMQRARIATLDATLRRAEAADTPPEILEGMRALRAQMVLGMEPRHARPSHNPPAG